MTKQHKTWKNFGEHPITHTTVHYLMTISDLRKEYGYARLTDIAQRLDISPGSCHTTLNKLKEKKFVKEDKNKFMSLTDKGEFVVDKIREHDKLLFRLFKDVLGVSEKQADIDACKIEHLISMETAKKLENFLKQHESK